MIEKNTGRNKDILQQIQNSKTIDVVDNLSKFSGISCFSNVQEEIKNTPDTINNPLMWTHYADQHKGICIEYDIPQELIINSKILGVTPVIYGENPLSEWLACEAIELFSKDELLMGYELLKKKYTIKSAHWQYENEVRLIKKEAGEIKIPRECLVSVYFGLRMEKNYLIKEILKNDNINYYQMIPDKTDFGIIPLALEQ